MAGLLRRAGVEYGRGISVNVANFYTDDQAAGYGKQLSDMLDGAGVIVDRSRNGAGAQNPPDNLSWCNPPGRVLGWPPVIGGQENFVNAWLWVKPPGESDEACRPGAPPAGEFWVEYALGLVKYQKQ
ncbi:MAG: hypothetical protein NVS3B29_01730 [Candidatus Saccharimonadales bacterium]